MTKCTEFSRAFRVQSRYQVGGAVVWWWSHALRWRSPANTEASLLLHRNHEVQWILSGQHRNHCVWRHSPGREGPTLIHRFCRTFVSLIKFCRESGKNHHNSPFPFKSAHSFKFWRPCWTTQPSRNFSWTPLPSLGVFVCRRHKRNTFLLPAKTKSFYLFFHFVRQKKATFFGQYYQIFSTKPADWGSILSPE